MMLLHECLFRLYDTLGRSSQSRIMKLTGELKQHRDPNAISSIQEVCCLALLMISCTM